MRFLTRIPFDKMGFYDYSLVYDFSFLVLYLENEQFGSALTNFKTRLIDSG